MRNSQHPILGTLTDKRVTIIFNGKSLEAIEGESIAAALLANEIRVLRYDDATKEPRGIYCGIGHCYECRVMINQDQIVRSCITKVVDNMVIRSVGEMIHE